ncbi:MAG: biopolymer transporter ExbD [Verrucomicrobiota bacterium]|jgi:biopolymer transport protein ExbD|nr:biopolymer transporter ExbD [Verrucomicrobiota bacterium]
MKFHRNAKLFRGQLDVAPFAGIFFLLSLMLVFSTLMVYSPGVQIELPEIGENTVPGILPPVITVAVDAQGKIFFESQHVEATTFSKRLQAIVERFESPPTLVIQGDQQANLAVVLEICHMASRSGVSRTLWATKTKPFSPPLSE